MISSGVAGPLGAFHLPRLWLKVSLDAADKLAAGYPGLGKGYDQMTCDALGLEAKALVDFITDTKPTYVQFEAWVRKNGKKLTKADIHRHNQAILGYNHDDASRKEILAEVGLPDDGSVLPCAVDLNNLQDWNEFHAKVLKGDSQPEYPVGAESFAGDHPVPVAGAVLPDPNGEGNGKPTKEAVPAT